MQVKAKQDNGVHIGEDGWLFLVGGTNRVLEQYRRSLRTWLRSRAWARLIRARTRRAQALGIRCVHTFVPEKLSIYDDRTGGLRYDSANSPARRLALRLLDLPGYVDLVAPLRAARDGPQPLYRRTDSHWTYDGCLIAYRAIMRACGAIPPPDIGQRRRFVSQHIGDLAEKLPDRQRESFENWAVQRDSRRLFANPLVQRHEATGRVQELHTGAHVIYENNSPHADPRTLVVFGDSCAHHAPIFLSGLLAESFREYHFIWSANVDWRYVERVRPDILLIELAERFQQRVPDDRFDVVAFAGSVPADAAGRP